MMRRDNFFIGLLPGLLLPVLVGTGYYIYNFGFRSARAYFDIFTNEAILSPLLAIGCFFNLVVFYLFLRFNRDRSAQGVITATILHGLIIVMMKLF